MTGLGARIPRIAILRTGTRAGICGPMYQPNVFRTADDTVVDALMHDHPFITLVTHDDGRLDTNHFPVLVEREGDGTRTIVGHMARANPQWRLFDGKREALCIFQGPHCYVSPSWYGEGVHVPTWNYAVVHAHGAPVLVEDRAAMERMMVSLVERFESPREHPWTLRLSDEDWTDLLKGIVGFRMRVTRLETKVKLSQNRLPEDRDRVTRALSSSPQHDERRVGALMERLNPR